MLALPESPMPHHRSPDSFRSYFAMIGILFAVSGLAPHAHARNFKTLHSFCEKKNCQDGYDANGLIRDQFGNLFGSTQIGGRHNGGGTIFELIGGKKFKLLYEFCPHRQCSEGDAPSNLIMDVAGNLYGTAFEGGSHQGGVAFELSPNADRTVWRFTSLYSFCSQGGNVCSDGSAPSALTYDGAASGEPYDGVSPLYGTASLTHDENGGGVAFELTPPAGRLAVWSESVIYRFCSQPNCADGRYPATSLLADGSGNLFGSTELGGTGSGTIFELSPSGGGSWTHTVLHNFCSSSNCEDGAYPFSPLISDSSGNLYGTAPQGGNPCLRDDGFDTCGVLFELVPNGTDSVETVLHRFCAEPDCADGAAPTSALLMDVSGNLFGVTAYGGGHDGDEYARGGGTVFEWSESLFGVLYSFCVLDQCADGAYPWSTLVVDGAGDFVGTTTGGGRARVNGPGTVFRIRH